MYMHQAVFSRQFPRESTYHSVLRSLSAPADSSSEDPSAESVPPLKWVSRDSYWYGSTVATASPSAVSDPELLPSNDENSQERLSSL